MISTNSTIKSVVIATSLTTAVLTQLSYEDIPGNVHYDPIETCKDWDLGALKICNLDNPLNLLQESHDLNALLGFANTLTRNSAELDPQIREVIEKNFWDMI